MHVMKAKAVMMARGVAGDYTIVDPVRELNELQALLLRERNDEAWESLSDSTMVVGLFCFQECGMSDETIIKALLMITSRSARLPRKPASLNPPCIDQRRG